MLPNTIVVAFDGRASFEASGESGCAVLGILHVPKVGEGDEPCGFVVDGQQRLAAISGCKHPDFPVLVTAIIAPDIAEQRRQLILVNRTKPLPQGLVYELLPEVNGTLPQALVRQQLASRLLTRLNYDSSSSLFRMIRTPTCTVGIIKDNSLRRMLVNSLSDGALFSVAEQSVGEAMHDKMVDVVSVFWAGLRQAFPKAWNLPPEKSRLTHGVGVVAMGYCMDHIYCKRPTGQEWSVETVVQALEPLKRHCAWTEGKWPFGEGEERQWNELQNTDRHVRLLMSHFRRVLEA